MFARLAGSGVQVGRELPVCVESRLGYWAASKTVPTGDCNSLACFHHRKMFIIDGTDRLDRWRGHRGLLLRRQLSRRFRACHGRRGRAVTARFLLDFRFHGGPLPSRTRPVLPSAGWTGPIPTTLVTNVPGEEHRAVTDATWDLIDHARRRDSTSSIHMLPTRRTLDRIISAARAACRSASSCPLESNAHRPSGRFEHPLPRTCRRPASRVYLHPILPHAKVIVADDRVLVGSTNLDAWALFRNWETSLVFEARRSRPHSKASSSIRMWRGRARQRRQRGGCVASWISSSTCSVHCCSRTRSSAQSATAMRAAIIASMSNSQ